MMLVALFVSSGSHNPFSIFHTLYKCDLIFESSFAILTVYQPLFLRLVIKVLHSCLYSFVGPLPAEESQLPNDEIGQEWQSFYLQHIENRPTDSR